MSSPQYRDCPNMPRSLYSNASDRQRCVSCPSSCSCNISERSVMDQLMIQAWQQGPKGHTVVFNTLSEGEQHSVHHRSDNNR